ncbi:unnamed protein product [Moneuplotes crassus]|uniref:Uncharacterized protein n=1 Tax=Euplotes crassus TaxID=5936 RepID=A0AAD1U8C8_EUPCR|nr:unnamed protein product [Moneuplotes crassus]
MGLQQSLHPHKQHIQEIGKLDNQYGEILCLHKCCFFFSCYKMTTRVWEVVSVPAAKNPKTSINSSSYLILGSWINLLQIESSSLDSSISFLKEACNSNKFLLFLL